MNIVQMLSRDVTDKQQHHFVQQQCHFVLISIKVPKKSQDVTTPKTNQYADSTEPAINGIKSYYQLIMSPYPSTLNVTNYEIGYCLNSCPNF